GGKNYYFYKSTSGKHVINMLATGWFYVNNYKYYANSNGVMQKGWRKIGGKTYYFYPKTVGKHYSHTAATGTVKIDNRTYVFNKSGVLIKVK
ncbi:MAG TPA: hypothetical protein DCR16_03700, partial [Lachnospiraceae bacterium]|nr:hypothetical protein [Lachnospiraceae bacterium]